MTCCETNPAEQEQAAEEVGGEDGKQCSEVLIERALKSITVTQEAVGRGAGGRELALVRTKLEEAFMWLQQAKVEMEGCGAGRR